MNDDIQNNSILQSIKNDITTNKIILSIFFAISGFLFFILLLDSHYKCIKDDWKQKIAEFGKSNKLK